MTLVDVKDVRRALRAVVPLLVIASGVVMVLAARERWWPACRLGDFDAPDCLRLQDHLYDFIPPTEPWVPVGAAAPLAALALGLLGLALVVLPWLLGRDYRPALTLCVGAVLGATVLAIAAMTWWSNISGQPFKGAGLTWAFWLWLLSPIALVFTAVAIHVGAPRAGFPWGVLVAVLVSASTPFGEFFLSSALLAYPSYDTTPWAEAVSGAFIGAAGLALWPAVRARTCAPAVAAGACS